MQIAVHSNGKSAVLPNVLVTEAQMEKDQWVHLKMLIQVCLWTVSMRYNSSKCGLLLHSLSCFTELYHWWFSKITLTVRQHKKKRLKCVCFLQSGERKILRVLNKKTIFLIRQHLYLSNMKQVLLPAMLCGIVGRKSTINKEAHGVGLTASTP